LLTRRSCGRTCRGEIQETHAHLRVQFFKPDQHLGRYWRASLGRFTQARQKPFDQIESQQVPDRGLGPFYCVETKSFTTPFLIRTKPEADVVVEDVWPQPWTLPFGILPLGSPERRMKKHELAERLPSLSDDGRHWTQLLHVEPPTVFALSQISEEDWAVLVSELAVE